MPSAGEIATKAASLVSNERPAQHGSVIGNFGRTAETWDTYIRTRRDPTAPLSATDVGHMMILFKLARTQSGQLNMDDYVDMAGYAACTGSIASSVTIQREDLNNEFARTYASREADPDGA